VIELAENRRQRQLWERDTLDRLRVGAGGRGGIEHVVTSYQQEGRVHVGETPAEVRAAMVANWDAGRRAGTSIVMIALRRADVDELNTRARALLVSDGDVAADGLEVGNRTFATGDRVVCLDNDRRLGVHNAMFATVVDVDTDGRRVVIEPDGRAGPRPLPHDYVAHHLDHAYATTIHKAQGATYDRALLLGDDRLYRQAGYTGLSRGRERNDIYLVVDDDREHDPELERHGTAVDEQPLERFIRALNRDGAKVLAHDAHDTPPPDVAVPLAALWERHDELVERLARTAPAAGRHGGLDDALQIARARETQAAIARTAREEQLVSVGIHRRRAQHHAQRALTDAIALEDRRSADRQRIENALRTASDVARRWGADHHEDLVEVARLRRGIGWRASLAGRAAEIDRPGHVVALLGDPPVDLDGRERWRTAAAAIESYHARWGEDPIGDTSDLPPDPRQAHHLAHTLDVASESSRAIGGAGGIEVEID
jgi:hypothetical protein